MFLYIYDKDLYEELLSKNYLFLHTTNVNNKICYVMKADKFNFSSVDKSKYFASNKLMF